MGQWGGVLDSGLCFCTHGAFTLSPTTSQMTITVTQEAFPVCLFSEGEDSKFVWDRFSFFAFLADSVGFSTRGLETVHLTHSGHLCASFLCLQLSFIKQKQRETEKAQHLKE